MSIQVSPALSNNTVFFKYEPFNPPYRFTGGSNFTASGTLVSYCSGQGSTALTFDSGSNGFLSIGAASGESLVVSCRIDDVLVSNSYVLFIKDGRFTLTPSNITPLTLYQNEPISNTVGSVITFTSKTPLTTVFSTPTLPLGLSEFTSSNQIDWILTGVPSIVSANSNYLILGSNATNGRLVTTSLAIQVKTERISITPSASNATLLLESPFVSGPFEVKGPLSATGNVVFLATNLPPGIGLTTTPLSPPLNPPSTLTVASLPTSVYLYGTPTFPGVSSTSYVTSISVLANGLRILSNRATCTFNYSPSIYFTNAQSTEFYLGVPSSAQYTAIVFPSSLNTVTYSTTSLIPPGLTFVNGVLSGTATSLWSNVFTIRGVSGLISNTATITLTVIPVSVTATSTISSSSFIVGKTISPITFTFSSPAYPFGTFLTSVTPALPPGFTATLFENTVIVSGTPTTVSSGLLDVEIQTLDGTRFTTGTSYTTIADTFTYSAPTTSFSWIQNVEITPVQFSVTTASGRAIVFFSGTPALPAGIYLDPYGVLQGIPRDSTTGSSNLEGIVATNRYSTLSPTVGQFTYSTIPDRIHLLNSNSPIQMTPSTAITIPFTYQSTSGRVLPTTTPITFSNYTYGLTFTLGGVSGNLESCSSSQIILPNYTSLNGLVGSNLIPTVLALSNLNPPTIHRETLRYTGSNYALYEDDGNLAFTIHTQGDLTVPRSLESSGNSIALADGTKLLSISINQAPFSRVLFSSNIIYSIYAPTLSRWIALPFDSTYGDLERLFFSSSSSNDWLINTTWTNNNFSIQGILRPNDDLNAEFILHMFNSNLMIAGKQLQYTILNSSPVPNESIAFFSNASYTLTNTLSLSSSSTRVVAAGTGSPTLLYSSDGITWSNAVNAFTSATYQAVWGRQIGSWLAIGSNTGTGVGVKYSLNGSTWIDIPFVFQGTPALGPIQFDGTSWCMFVNSNVGSPLISGGIDSSFSMYRHDALNSTLSNVSTWTITPVTFAGATQTDVPRLISFPPSRYASNGPPVPSLQINNTSLGPTFTQPTITEYLVFQYVPITPITVYAGEDVIYFLGNAASLPPGMVWNASTGTISGLSVQLGVFTLELYAQSLTGVSRLVLTFKVNRVPIHPNLPTASSYTSYLREKVVADSASSAINAQVVPFEVGTFLLERPPVITTAPEICCETYSSSGRTMS